MGTDNSSDDAKSIILEKVVPALGALVSTIMYAAPTRAVLRADKEKVLGDLNPVPLAVTIVNTVVWGTYGLVKQDPFVTTPNVPGIAMAVYFTLTTYGLADDKLRWRLRALLSPAVLVLMVLGVVTSFALDTQDQRMAMWGVCGNVISLVYYGAPLSTMADVLRTRSSASILLPLTVMNTVNAALWTTYGLATWDIYVWVPNGIGLLLSLAQLLLRALFPAKSRAATQTYTHKLIPEGTPSSSSSTPV